VRWQHLAALPAPRAHSRNPRTDGSQSVASGLGAFSSASPRHRRHRTGRHPTARRHRQRAIHRALLSFRSRARRGTSGALNLQSAIAGLNPLPRSPSPNAARRRDVEDRVPRSGEPRTVSDPEGSSTKRSSSGAAERPGPSRSSWWARERPGRRRVHGISNPRVRRERRRS